LKTDPQIKQKILQIVDRQIKSNNPPAARETFNHLIISGYQPDKALEMIAMVLVEDVLNALDGKAFDEKDYTRRLRGLK
jgi:hypothetical protein